MSETLYRGISPESYKSLVETGTLKPVDPIEKYVDVSHIAQQHSEYERFKNRPILFFTSSPKLAQSFATSNLSPLTQLKGLFRKKYKDEQVTVAVDSKKLKEAYELYANKLFGHNEVVVPHGISLKDLTIYRGHQKTKDFKKEASMAKDFQILLEKYAEKKKDDDFLVSVEKKNCLYITCV